MNDSDPRATLTMEAFDSLPASFRAFCADYPRTARGQDLVAILEQCDGNITAAQALLAALLPADVTKPASPRPPRRDWRG